MTETPSLSDQIWAGEPEGLARARKVYAEKGDLVAFASALYSYRNNPEVRAELLALIKDSLIPFASGLRAELGRIPGTNREMAAKAETAAAILYWASEQSSLEEHFVTHLAAEQLVTQGLRLATRKQDVHVPCLLHITAAKLMLAPFGRNLKPDKKNRKEEVAAHLKAVTILAPSITDSRQQVRVWKLLADVYRQEMLPRLSAAYLRRALTAPGVEEEVRFKHVPRWVRTLLLHPKLDWFWQLVLPVVP